MAARSANVTSIDAIRDFRAALQHFAVEARDVLAHLRHEVDRVIDWVENDRRSYWEAEGRKAENEWLEAKQTLQWAEQTVSGEDHRTCHDHRKRVEKAKKRRELCERKLVEVKHWRLVLVKEVEELETQLTKADCFLDSELERSLALLERMAAALQRYAQSPLAGAGAGSGEASAGAAAGAASSAMALEEVDLPEPLADVAVVEPPAPRGG